MMDIISLLFICLFLFIILESAHCNFKLITKLKNICKLILKTLLINLIKIIFVFIHIFIYSFIIHSSFLWESADHNFINCLSDVTLGVIMYSAIYRPICCSESQHIYQWKTSNINIC